MSLIRADPFEQWFREMRQFFERPFTLVPLPFLREGREFAPAVEVYEQGEEIVVRAELPGVNKDQVEVRVNPDSVEIRGEVRQEVTREQAGYYVSERRYGNFHRVVPFHVPVDPDSATARFHEGLLTVRVRKVKDEGRGRRVPIEG